MSHDHAADERGVGGARANAKPIAIALGATALYMVAEFVGGLWTNSLALLADAGHMATDVVALALSLFAIWIARRPATPEKTFGYYRTEVLAALFNAVFLILLTVYIFYEAFQRAPSPPEVDSLPMMFIAVGGLLINGFSAWVLSRGGGHQHNLNTRGAFLHVVSDMLGSVGAIVAAIVMLTTDWYLVDPILSAGIGLLVLFSAWRLLRESMDVLMESAPKDIDADKIRDVLLQVDGVESAHDIHVWTVTSGFVSLSSHVVVSSDRPWNDVLTEAAESLRKAFSIVHITLQPEIDGDTDFVDCAADPASDDDHCLTSGEIETGQHSHAH